MGLHRMCLENASLYFTLKMFVETARSYWLAPISDCWLPVFYAAVKALEDVSQWLHLLSPLDTVILLLWALS